MTITSIVTTRKANGHYVTSICYLDDTGNVCMTDQTNPQPQGIEEFLRNFRIEHNLRTPTPQHQ